MPIQQVKKRQFWFDRNDYKNILPWFLRKLDVAIDAIRDFALDVWRGMPTLILFFVPVVAGIVFIVLVAIVATITHFAVMLLVLAVSMIAMPIMDLIHLIPIRVYQTWERIERRRGYNVYVCPYHHEDIWETDWRVPLYKCLNPECDERHSLLWPSTYGVFHHKCGGLNGECNTTIPTVNWLGRPKLKCFCPVCGERIRIKGLGLMPRVGFALVGSPSAGKTSFMEAAIDELKADPSVKIESADEDLGLSNVMDPEAFVWRVKTQRKSRLMYLYDPDGEAYTSMSVRGGNRFLSQADGLLLVIDPFSLDIKDVARPDHAANVEPSAPLTTIVSCLERLYDVMPGTVFNIPIAVVVTKSDMAGASELFGGADSEVVREGLINIAGMGFVHQIEHTFSSVNYFAVSAEDGSDVDKPFLWLLSLC